MDTLWRSVPCPRHLRTLEPGPPPESTLTPEIVAAAPPLPNAAPENTRIAEVARTEQASYATLPRNDDVQMRRVQATKQLAVQQQIFLGRANGFTICACPQLLVVKRFALPGSQRRFQHVAACLILCIESDGRCHEIMHSKRLPGDPFAQKRIDDRVSLRLTRDDIVAHERGERGLHGRRPAQTVTRAHVC
jgi:hypothetical protein